MSEPTKDGVAATLLLGQHPATHSAWMWLDENRERIGPEAADDIDVLLRRLSSELWRLDRGR